MRRPGMLLVALAMVLLGGCRVDVTAQVRLTPTGAGSLQVVVSMDQETAARLTSAGLSLLPPTVAGWEVEERVDDDTHDVVATTSFDDPSDLAARVDELAVGLDDEDPALLEAFDVVVTGDGGLQVDAVAGLRLPTSAGADAPDFPTREELAALASEVTATLVVDFPGSIETSNASRVDGTTATWDLPVDDTIVVEAVSAAPSPWQQAWVPAAVGAVVLVVLLWVLRRLIRRRGDRRAAPLGRVERMR